MPKKEPDSAQLMKLIHEVERLHPRAEADREKQLMYLLEGLISQSPEEALQFFTTHRENGIRSLHGLQSLTVTLADRLLGKRKLQSVEELFRLASELHLPVDSTTQIGRASCRERV